ncbi:MAG: hypothetical protein JWP01_3050 [Myxococcales bacterium]|nr:hypothetical protein [Myxococcales bacterium]
MMRLLLGTLLVLGACTTGGGSEPPTPDASLSMMGVDGGGAMIDSPLALDGGQSNVCTGKAYDTCTSNAQCTSGNCRAFGSAGFQVCTQACSAGTPCPMQNGAAVSCNNMGLCRPTAANACTPSP